MHFFVGTKNPPMPPNFYKSEVKPLKVSSEQIIQSRLSLEKDFMKRNIQRNIDKGETLTR